MKFSNTTLCPAMCQPTHGRQVQAAANCGKATLILGGLKIFDIVSDAGLFSYARRAARWRPATAGWTPADSEEIFSHFCRQMSSGRL